MPLTQVSSRAIEDTLRYVLGSVGSVAYTFTGKGLNGAVSDPTLTLSRGHTYIFENRNSNGAHPFYIKTSLANGGTNDAYNTGVTNNGGAGGTEIVFTVPHDAPDLLYYQCSSHSSMNGQLKIAGAVADGSITESKLADNAVTTNKIADNAVTFEQLASNTVKTGNIEGGAITTDRLADQAVTLAKLPHGDGSNDGKFLRANNGADPSFETVTGTTINNNADNRVVTGSGTANTLEGEADLTYDGSKLQINDSSLSQLVQSYSGNNRFKILAGSNFLQMISQNDVSLQFRYATDTGSGSEICRITPHGLSFDGNAAADSLDDYEEGEWTPTFDAPDQSSTTFGHHRQHGYYTKIGNIVHVACYIQGYTASNDGGGSNDGLVITGLPFTVAPLPSTSNVRHAASFALGSRYRVICDDLVCNAFGNTTVAKLWEPSSGNTMGQLKTNDITARGGTNEILFSGSYRVA